jgi:hypothetical protein
VSNIRINPLPKRRFFVRYPTYTSIADHYIDDGNNKVVIDACKTNSGIFSTETVNEYDHDQELPVRFKEAHSVSCG